MQPEHYSLPPVIFGAQEAATDLVLFGLPGTSERQARQWREAMERIHRQNPLVRIALAGGDAWSPTDLFDLAMSSHEGQPPRLHVAAVGHPSPLINGVGALMDAGHAVTTAIGLDALHTRAHMEQLRLRGIPRIVRLGAEEPGTILSPAGKELLRHHLRNLDRLPGGTTTSCDWDNLFRRRAELAERGLPEPFAEYLASLAPVGRTVRVGDDHRPATDLIVLDTSGLTDLAGLAEALRTGANLERGFARAAEDAEDKPPVAVEVPVTVDLASGEPLDEQARRRAVSNAFGHQGKGLALLHTAGDPRTAAGLIPPRGPGRRYIIDARRQHPVVRESSGFAQPFEVQQVPSTVDTFTRLGSAFDDLRGWGPRLYPVTDEPPAAEPERRVGMPALDLHPPRPKGPQPGH